MTIATRSVKILAAAALLLSAARVSGGVLTTDSFAIGGIYQGNAVFPTITNGTFSTSASVDFAVFAPGQFDLGPDPSGGTQYVYAYQVFNPGPGVGPSSLGAFTVGILPGKGGTAAAAAANAGFVASAGVAPTTSTITGASSVWDFSGGNVLIGGNSKILLFTSPHAPILQLASVQGVQVSSYPNIPSPVPEPSTFVLCGIGAVALYAARRRFFRG